MKWACYLSMLLLALLLISCASEETPPLVTLDGIEPIMTDVQTKEAISYLTFSVFVGDHEGNPLPNLQVRVYRNGEPCNEALSDDDGEVSFTLVMGEAYGVAVTSPDGTPLYYEEAVDRVNTDHTEIRITVYDAVSDSRDVFGYPPSTEAEGHSYTAYYLEEGIVYAPIAASDRSYFIFTPPREGIYRVTFDAEADLSVGLYGSPANIQRSPLSEVSGNVFTFEVKKSHMANGTSVTTPFVIGVIAGEGAEGAIVTLERVGDVAATDADMPWTDMNASEDLDAFKLKRGVLIDLDLTDPELVVVFSEKDGYYHLGDIDGPTVLLRITQKSRYLEAFTTICDHTRLGAYVYDDEGNLARKENFNPLILAYGEVCDSQEGVYPLDAALADMLNKVGDQRGWYDLEGNTHLFGEEVGTIRQEMAWLFACCYLFRG